MDVFRKLKRRSMKDSGSLSRKIRLYQETQDEASFPDLPPFQKASKTESIHEPKIIFDERKDHPYYQLHKIVSEIVDTEKDYVKDLQTMIEVNKTK